LRHLCDGASVVNRRSLLRDPGGGSATGWPGYRGYLPLSSHSIITIIMVWTPWTVSRDRAGRRRGRPWVGGGPGEPGRRSMRGPSVDSRRPACRPLPSPTDSSTRRRSTRDRTGPSVHNGARLSTKSGGLSTPSAPCVAQPPELPGVHRVAARRATGVERPRLTEVGTARGLGRRRADRPNRRRSAHGRRQSLVGAHR
jgi:hypothetical protein